MADDELRFTDEMNRRFDSVGELIPQLVNRIDARFDLVERRLDALERRMDRMGDSVTHITNHIRYHPLG